jgi:hypothetical protein
MALTDPLSTEQAVTLAILAFVVAVLFVFDPVARWIAAKRSRTARGSDRLLAHRASLDLPDHRRGSGARMSALFDDESRVGSPLREQEDMKDARWRTPSNSTGQPYRGGDAA